MRGTSSNIVEGSRAGERRGFGAAFCKPALLALILALLVAPLRAAEIATYTDKDGRSIYVTVEDRDLTQAVKQGGVTAGIRLLDQRKRALPGVEELIAEVSAEQGLDPKLVHAVIEVESAWNPRARSIKGALGLMQLMPETASRFGVTDPFNPEQNIRAGARYLRVLLDQFRQNLTHALAAYNAGEGAVIAHNGVPPYAETKSYITRINALYRKLQSAEVRIAESRPSLIVPQRLQDGRILYTNIE